jgi:hypothetical protein
MNHPRKNQYTPFHMSYHNCPLVVRLERDIGSVLCLVGRALYIYPAFDLVLEWTAHVRQRMGTSSQSLFIYITYLVYVRKLLVRTYDCYSLFFNLFTVPFFTSLLSSPFVFMPVHLEVPKVGRV